MIKNILAFFIISILCSCIILPIPHNECNQPEIHGIIVDKETGLPISNVTIKLNDTLFSTTDEKGEFHFSPKCERKIWMFIVMDPAFRDLKLYSSHPEYEENEISQQRHYRKNNYIDFGKIYLQRKKR